MMKRKNVFCLIYYPCNFSTSWEFLSNFHSAKTLVSMQTFKKLWMHPIQAQCFHLIHSLQKQLFITH